jgi:hypothetical protein
LANLFSLNRRFSIAHNVDGLLPAVEFRKTSGRAGLKCQIY